MLRHIISSSRFQTRRIITTAGLSGGSILGRQISRDLLFAGLCSGVAFGTCSLVYTKTQVDLIKESTASFRSSVWSTVTDMMNRIRNMEIMESMAGNKIDYQTFRKRQEWIDYIQRMNNTPEFLKDIGITVVEKWYSLSSSQKFLACMISVNVAVFLLWQVPPMFRLMDEFFINRFITRYTPSPSITLLTSAFSHKDFMHLGFNMFGLWSFGPAAIASMGSPYHFLSFYISSGVFSSLCSRYLRGFSYGGSLGASGALFSIVAYLAVNRPDMKLSLIFLPMFPFSIGEGLSALALFDLFCILTGRFVFDHIAHLGGVAFGLMYAHFNGVEIWRRFERMSLSYWRKKDKNE